MSEGGPPSNKIELEKLIHGKLPTRIIQAIEEMELTVEEVLEWETGKPKIRVVATESDLQIALRLRIPIKEMLGTLGLMVAWLLAGW